jgi:hypothetical protein
MRTNEREMDWDWSFRQFEVDNGTLVQRPLFNTPDRSLNATERLGAFVLQNQEAILEDRHVLPKGYLGGNATPTTGSWSVPRATESVRKAFAQATCDGCHQTEAVPADFNFHVSPFRSGVARLSPFLHNPDDPTHDELARRSDVMRGALCGL